MSSDKAEFFLTQLREYAARHGQEPPYFLDQTIRQRLQEQIPEGPLSPSATARKKPQYHSETFREQQQAYADSHPRSKPYLAPELLERLRQHTLTDSPDDEEAPALAARTAPVCTASRQNWWQDLLTAARELLAGPAFMGAVATLAVVAVVVVVVMRTAPLALSPFVTALAQLEPATATVDMLDTLTEPGRYGFSSRGGNAAATVVSARLGLDIGQLQMLAHLDPTRVTTGHITALADLLHQLPVPANHAIAAVSLLQSTAVNTPNWQQFIHRLDHYAATQQLQTPLAFGVWLAQVRMMPSTTRDNTAVHNLLARATEFTGYFQGQDLPVIRKLLADAQTLAVQPAVSVRNLRELQRTASLVIEMELHL